MNNIINKINVQIDKNRKLAKGCCIFCKNYKMKCEGMDYPCGLFKEVRL